ncbi:uncharacterized protein [Onthophagus taurus]|uniref:uncharacterized protein isoform X2 n=1 Tax=Onthophagus taurus TaxID=166361 RepID=UPI000C20C3F6|nr:uncharacterized protein LOC111413415 isoform X2 [Onthophagus taurus]
MVFQFSFSLKPRFILENVSLREERKRTGRYIAAGTAILLTLLAVYQALVGGTPQYAALFVPALIMFVYLLCILHASKHQQRLAKAMEQEALKEIIVEKVPDIFNNTKPLPKSTSLVRSYSIA